ncbi:MAG: bifunctional phosphopantothenoylcysteine decarboxylase/phosphopantothenate--cysteine ligase CoaBC [Firmicutes bacterium]|nr:bifunctional phosphopantothenoylcysteine decarboxylase/phosphopantothenate--cysteine ligase CoaBC [Bacillota bacterium]
MLSGKTVILGVTGSIAAYKSAALASLLVKQNCDVHVIMTKNALQFITPLTFETLTGNKCIYDTFDRNFSFDVKHISLAKKADIIIVAPATANIIGKIASGIADDMLTTTIMAAKCPKLISPAMNTGMYTDPIFTDNLEKLRRYSYKIITPASGRLACGDIGIGKMPEPEQILEHILYEIAFPKDLSGKNILVTAGPTCEPIDPVRYITNHSTGKMGYALAKAAAYRGGNVTLVAGKTALLDPLFINTVHINSAKDMFDAVKDNFPSSDYVFKSAAVADYTPSDYSDQKIKKNDDDMSINLTRTDDILKYLGENKKENQFVCGFSMETQNLLENSKKKLISKNIDMIVANDLNTEGAGFGTDTNVVTLITKNSIANLPKLSKSELSHKILDFALVKTNKNI